MKRRSRNEPGGGAPYGPPQTAEPDGGVRGLFERAVGLARRDAQRARAENARKSPGHRALDWARGLSVIVALGIGAFGVASWPDAPLRRTPAGVAGKHGQPYPVEEYGKFRLWERAFVGSIALAFALNVAGLLVDRRRARRNG